VWVSYGVTSALSIAGGVTATADRFATNDDLVRLPGYVRADTAVAWRLRRVDVAINARNLLDRRYVDTASTNFQIAPGAPREVVVTLRVGR
jgi:outer membrane receptor protein involved in Fe transport